MKEKIQVFIIDYLQREYTIDCADILEMNYIEQGYIDSMGIIQFIATIEDEFGIQFTDEELASEEFKVVGSLIDMIEAKF